jgi:hypothetical protein
MDATTALSTIRRVRPPLLLLCFGALLTGRFQAHAQETRPIRKTKADQQRNAALLAGYDYGKYATSLTGYTRQDRQRIAVVQYQHAVRTRVGDRGNHKARMAQLPDGKLVLATYSNYHLP